MSRGYRGLTVGVPPADDGTNLTKLPLDEITALDPNRASFGKMLWFVLEKFMEDISTSFEFYCCNQFSMQPHFHYNI